MTLQEILELTRAGFTKEDIIALGAVKTTEDQKSAKAEPEQKKEEPAKNEKQEKAEPEQKKEEPAKNEKQEKEEDPIAKAIQEHLDTMMKPIEDHFAKIAKLAGMPSLDNVEPKGIDDIISHFFKEE